MHGLTGSPASIASMQIPTTAGGDTTKARGAHENAREQDPATHTHKRATADSSRQISVQFDQQALSQQQAAAGGVHGKRVEEAKGSSTGNHSSLLSVVVKNPLRQGLQWAGGGHEEDAVRMQRHEVQNDEGGGGEEGRAGPWAPDGESPSLMSILVRYVARVCRVRKCLREPAVRVHIRLQHKAFAREGTHDSVSVETAKRVHFVRAYSRVGMYACTSWCVGVLACRHCHCAVCGKARIMHLPKCLGLTATSIIPTPTSLLCSLARRPLRGGLALAEQLQQAAAPTPHQSSAPEASHGATGGGKAHGHADGEGARPRDSAPKVDLWKRNCEGARERKDCVDQVKDMHLTSRLPGRTRAGDEAEGGSDSHSARVENGRRRDQERDGGGERGIGESGSGEDGVQVRGGREESGGRHDRAESLMSVVVKGPLRRTGWLEKDEEEDREGVATKREHSLLSVVVRCPPYVAFMSC